MILKLSSETDYGFQLFSFPETGKHNFDAPGISRWERDGPTKRWVHSALRVADMLKPKPSRCFKSKMKNHQPGTALLGSHRGLLCIIALVVIHHTSVIWISWKFGEEYETPAKKPRTRPTLSLCLVQFDLSSRAWFKPDAALGS